MLVRSQDSAIDMMQVSIQVACHVCLGLQSSQDWSQTPAWRQR
jgi:hypothetical protein